MHTPSRTAIRINVAGNDETRTITREELVAIHMALVRFESPLWVGAFTDFFSSLQVIRYHHNNPGAYISHRVHHYTILLRSISYLLEIRRTKVLLHKIGTKIYPGQNLADKTAKVAVMAFDTLPPDQALRVNVGAIAPRHPN